MSQITRCPSCETTFRVVPDQLRISEGWVRCGQCKNVFDASEHMLAVVQQPLLPDVSLTDVRAPITKAQPKEPAAVWGRPERPQAPPVALQPPSAPLPQPDPPLPPAADAPAMLQVPAPEIPAFLAADAPLVVEKPLAPGVAGKSVADAKAHPFPPLPGHIAAPEVATQPAASLPQSALPPEAPKPELPAAEAQASPLNAMDAMAPPLPPAVPTPAAPHKAAELPSVEYPAAPAAKSKSSVTGAPVALKDYEVEAESLPLPEVAFPMSVPAESAGDEARAVAQGAAAKVADGASDMSDLGFVRDAQRAAFWRRPAVRAVAATLALVLLVALAGQVAVHERQRIVAMEPRALPWLQTLCEPLGCDWGPARQINDVLIDSSSFSKARGDSYVLSFTLKSRGAVALETPALELTLTDAQDQAVLRRVLTPADMGAPSAINARGEWSGHLAVVVTTGGARVAGYRLLAFYP